MARSEQETRGQDIKGGEMENDKNNSHEVVEVVEVVNIFHQQLVLVQMLVSPRP
jgi:hypothetical protein